MYFFGLIYNIVFLGKVIEVEKIEMLRGSVDLKITELKKDAQHVRAPGHLKYLRLRIDASINIYNKYVTKHAL